MPASQTLTTRPKTAFPATRRAYAQAGAHRDLCTIITAHADPQAVLAAFSADGEVNTPLFEVPCFQVTQDHEQMAPMGAAVTQPPDTVSGRLPVPH